jgi:threonine dehydrogenase-like Zn-dependent dehydrogenase
MKAIGFHGIGDIRLDDVKEPKIKNRYDAIVRLTASAICGTDLHLVRGTAPDMVPVLSWATKALALSRKSGRKCATSRSETA